MLGNFKMHSVVFPFFSAADIKEALSDFFTAFSTLLQNSCDSTSHFDCI